MWGSVANSGLVGSAVVDGNSIDFIAVDIELTTSGLNERDEVPTGYKRFILKILFSERKLILFFFFFQNKLNLRRNQLRIPSNYKNLMSKTLINYSFHLT